MRLQLKLVISWYSEPLQHRGRVSELWVEENEVEEESALLMGKKEGRIIDFIALPRAGP